MTTGLVDYMAGQAPTTHPGIDMLIASVQYASGQNPYDFFRGNYAIPEQVFKAGGKRSHESFLKWLANKSGSTLVHRFKTNDLDRIKTDLERVVGYPFASNIVGRFVKVSDRGIKEEIRNIKYDIQSNRAKELLDVKDTIIKWVNGESLTEAEKNKIIANPEIIDRNTMTFLSRRYGNVFMEEFLTSTSIEEKGAVLKRWMERNKLLKESQK